MIEVLVVTQGATVCQKARVYDRCHNSTHIPLRRMNYLRQLGYEKSELLGVSNIGKCLAYFYNCGRANV